VESREEFDARFPALADLWETLGIASATYLPLVAAGETVGVVSFGFAEPRTFTVEDRAFLLAVGQQAALAVERARLFEAERLARQEAEAANRSKAQVLATMSHELRTPLNAIGGYVDLMELEVRGPVNDAQREDLRRIKRSQHHLLGLINEVLNYAKIESGAVSYALEDVSVRDVLTQAEGLVAPQARARGLALRIEEAPRELVVRADAEKLRQVLVNLLVNAVKFTDVGGAVTVGAARAGDAVSIHVRDTGVGIAPEQLEAIFEPFVQLGRTLSARQEGVGLGLAISRDLARGMGGDLTAESALGVGSVFRLTLPRA
jgi:signal transduction histidine kinase